MIVDAAIRAADAQAHNDIEPDVKRRWLSELDAQLLDEVYKRHVCRDIREHRLHTNELTGDPLDNGADAGRTVDRVDPDWYGDPDDWPRGYDSTVNSAVSELLVPYPYDGLYVDYLVMRIYGYINEIERYNNAMTIYNESLRRFENHYNQTRTPRTVPALRF